MHQTLPESLNEIVHDNVCMMNLCVHLVDDLFEEIELNVHGSADPNQRCDLEHVGVQVQNKAHAAADDKDHDHDWVHPEHHALQITEPSPALEHELRNWVLHDQLADRNLLAIELVTDVVKDER